MRPQPHIRSLLALGDQLLKSRDPRQQRTALAHPGDHAGQQRLRAVTGHPRLIGDPGDHLCLDLGEGDQLVLPLDLPRVFEFRLLAIGIGLQARRIFDRELFSQIGDQLSRNVEEIGQEKPQVADSDQLEGETQPITVTPPRRDQLAVLIVEVEEPLELDPRQHRETPVSTDTLITHSRT